MSSILQEKKPIHFIAIAAILSIFLMILVFPSIFHLMPPGLNIPLSIILFYLAILIGFKGKYSLTRHKNYLLLILIFLHTLVFLFFNNGLILFFNYVVLLALICLQIALMTGHFSEPIFGRRFVSSIAHILFVAPFHKIGSLFSQTFSSTSPDSKNTKKVIGGILIGIAIALPLVAIVLLLLTSADMIFEKMASEIFTWSTIGDLFGYLFLFATFFILCGSAFLSFSGNYEPTAAKPKKGPARFNLVAVYIIVSAISIILVCFSVVQCKFLFGETSLPYNFTYAEYARTGFFQLCGAAAFCFAIIAILLAFTQHAKGGARIGLNILFTIMTVSIIMLLVSAFMRMVLYENAFSFTRLRLYTQAFMILLAVICLFTIAKIWKRSFKISKTVLVSLSLALLCLSFFNVDGFIAKKNVEKANTQSEEINLEHLLSLSSDALPYYVDALDESLFTYEEPKSYYEYYGLSSEEFDALPTETQEKYLDEHAQYEEKAYNELYQANTFRTRFIHLYENATNADIRGYNFGRARANNALKGKEALYTYAKAQQKAYDQNYDFTLF